MFRNLALWLLCGFVLTSCGSSRMITVSPASADAHNFPNGIVQFRASGISSPTWCVGSASGTCNGNIAAVATVDTNGNAQCLSGRTGTATILAGVGTQGPVPDSGMQLSSFGSAQLTCP